VLKCTMDWLWSLSCLSDKAYTYPNPTKDLFDRLVFECILLNHSLKNKKKSST
jgi:hypothetical protein